MTQGELGTAAEGKVGHKAGMKSHLFKVGLVFPLKIGNRKHSFKKAKTRKRKNPVFPLYTYICIFPYVYIYMEWNIKFSSYIYIYKTTLGWKCCFFENIIYTYMVA